MQSTSETPQTLQNTANKPENPLVSILVNVVLPYYILTKAGAHLGPNGPTLALLIALSLPLIYGINDYRVNARANYVSIFGLLNTLFTGGLALLQLGSDWFVFKEAAFPFILGVFVFYTSFTDKPFVAYMLNFSQALDVGLIQRKLEEKQQTGGYKVLLKNSNILFSVSFFLSSLLNFLLAKWIFKDIDKSLPEQEFATQLNQQIADMTWMGYVVIALPMMVFVMIVLFRFVKGLQKLTELSLEEMMPQAHKPKA